MKKDIAEYFAKSSNCQQVKVKKQRHGGIAQKIDLLEWKWEMTHMEFITGLQKFQMKHDFIWVIVDRMTKSAHFLQVRTTY